VLWEHKEHQMLAGRSHSIRHKSNQRHETEFNWTESYFAVARG